MDPFSFASSEALDIPLNIRMCVFFSSLYLLELPY
jgi:hypothetical protein